MSVLRSCQAAVRTIGDKTPSCLRSSSSDCASGLSAVHVVGDSIRALMDSGTSLDLARSEAAKEEKA